MSGHSKWATTKRQKGAADAKRGALFTKLSNAISVAAREGGGDLDSNFKLRLAVDLAKTSNMPKDNIERAIKRGTGELAGGPIESITYEGFGPGGVALLIEALTDNRNRTSQAIKHLFTKYNGSLGGPNSVAWMFESHGVIRVAAVDETLELYLIDAGAQDITRDAAGVIILTAPNDLKKISDLLKEKDVAIDYAEIDWIAKEKKAISKPERTTLEKLFDDLDDEGDVNNYYSNVADEK